MLLGSSLNEAYGLENFNLRITLLNCLQYHPNGGH
jgi:hypothetical protein